MKQRKQLLNSLGLPSPHLSQHLLRLLLLLVTAIGGVGSSWADEARCSFDTEEIFNSFFNVSGGTGFSYSVGTAGIDISGIKTISGNVNGYFICNPGTQTGDDALLTTKNSYDNIRSIVFKGSTGDNSKTSIYVQVSASEDFSNPTTVISRTVSSIGNNKFFEISGADLSCSGYVRIVLSQTGTNGTSNTSNKPMGVDELVITYGNETCATPTLTPTANGFTLSCATSGATIYYTLNGSLANAEGNNTGEKDYRLVYNGEVTVNADTWVSAYAVKDGYTDSDVLGVTKVAKTQPSVSGTNEETIAASCQTDRDNAFSGLTSVSIAGTFNPGSPYGEYCKYRLTQRTGINSIKGIKIGVIPGKIIQAIKIEAKGNNDYSAGPTIIDGIYVDGTNNKVFNGVTIPCSSSNNVTTIAVNDINAKDYILLDCSSTKATQTLAKITVYYDDAPALYTVTFDGNSLGKSDEASLTEASAGAGITLPKATPNGALTFIGWDSNDDGTADKFAGDTYNPTADITLKAIYRASTSAVGKTTDDAGAASPWFSAFSDYYTVPEDGALVISFTNHRRGDANYNNWNLDIANDKDRNAADYAEYAIFRSDLYGWGANYVTPTSSDYPDWSTFNEKMDGARVDITLERNNGTLTFTAKATPTTGEVYTETSTLSGTINGTVRAFLVADNSYMTDVTTATKSRIDHIRTTGDGCNKEVVLLNNGAHNYLKMTAANADNTAFGITGLSTEDYDVVVTGDDVITIYKQVTNNNSQFYVKVTAKNDVTGTANVKIVFNGNNEYLPVESPEVAITVVEGATLTYSAGTGGSVTAKTPGGSAIATGSTIASGKTVTFTATPDEWFMVENWYDGTTNLAGSQTSYSTAITGTENIKANFKRYYLLTTAAENGTVSVVDNNGNPITSETKLLSGSKIIATATPADGYKFVRWELSNALNTTVSYNEASFTANKIEDFLGANTQALATLTAVFEVDNVTTVENPVIKYNDAEVAGTTAIKTGEAITMSTTTDGATIGYVWTGSEQSAYTSAENIIAVAEQYIKYSSSNTHTTSTSGTGDRYLYAFAKKGDHYSDVVMAHFTATKPDNSAEWDYTGGNPSDNPDNGLSYNEVTTGSNASGIKMDSKGYAYFDKGNTTEAGTLTIVWGVRNTNGPLSLGVYANTSNDGTLAGDATLIGTTQLCTRTGLTVETIEIPESARYIYIKRASGNEGVISKLTWIQGGTAQTVTGTASAGGSIAITNDEYTVNSGTKIYTGAELSFTATPQDEDYKLTLWTDAANGYSASNNKFDIAVGNEALTVGATFGSSKTASDLAVAGGKKTINVNYGAAAKTLEQGVDYTTSSAGAITFATSNPAVATVSADGTITFVGVGTANITLTQEKAGDYLEGTAVFNVTVNRITPTITASLSNVTIGVDNNTNVTLGSNSDGEFSVSANNSNATATVKDNVVTITGNTVGTSTITVTQAASGNYAQTTTTINVTVEAAVGEGTVLEVRGARHSGSAPYYFTNSNSSTEQSFTRTDNDIKNKISPLSKDQISAAFGVAADEVTAKSDYKITINLNSSSASKIVACVNGGGGDRKITKILVNDVEINGWTQDPATFSKKSNDVTRVTINNLNINQGDKVEFHFSNSAQLYYFEVYSKSPVSAPKITDNGDAKGTITTNTNGATIKYLVSAERKTTLPAVSELTSTIEDGKTTVISATSYVYAVAEKGGIYSDISEGLINVETIPSLSCRINVETDNVVAKTIKVGETATAKTTATMNKADATDQFTYVYESDNTSNATVNASTGVITGVSTGAAKITVNAKKNGETVATDFVVVVVTSDDLVTPLFTWGGDPTAQGNQFDVEVGANFSDKTPKAYKETGEGDDVRYSSITDGYNITYYSSNGNATVNSSGRITGVSEGTTTIIAVFAPKGDYEGSYNGGIAEITANVRPKNTAALTVSVANNPSDIDLSSQVLTYQSAAPSSVKAGEVELSSDNYRVAYESNNWNVATVNATTGLVTAHNVGTATITVAYVPINSYAQNYKAFIHTYTITVKDPTRFIITEGYGYDGSKTSTIEPLSTVTDPFNYVTMTFGGWRGVNGTAPTEFVPVVDSSGNVKSYGAQKGTKYGNDDMQDYWGGSGDGGKTDAAGANPDYPYAITAKSSGNPKPEGNNFNYDPSKPANSNQFSVPCRGAYIMFEPSVDGTITANILQNGILDSKNWSGISGNRFVYIIDEFGKVVTPIAYGMASDVKNPTLGKKDTSSSKNELSSDTYLAALKNVSDNPDAVTEIPTSGPDAPGNVERVIKVNQGYAVLTKGPSFYTFNVKAGKKYYIFGNGTKNGFYGFQFRKDEKFAPVTAEISTEVTSGNSTAIVAGRSMNLTQAAALYDGKAVEITEYNRSFTKDVWQPLVLPYSMNDIQVKAIFGDGVDILYVDDVKGETIKMSHHFYKTIVAGKSCLIKPSQNVTSLATSNIVKDGVAYPYVTFSNVGITGYSDYTTDKSMTGYKWSASYDPQTVTGGDYYINTSGNYTRLAAEKSATLKGCRAFLKVTSSGAKALTVMTSSFDDEDGSATGIIGVIVDEEGGMDVVMKNDKIYDLSGRAINSESMIKGNIYIHNGKKFIAQ